MEELTDISSSAAVATASDVQEQQRAEYERHNEEDSPLLRLPAELRNEIYRLRIDHSPRTIFYCGRLVPIEPGTITTEAVMLSLALTKAGHLRTCRALRREALSLFYGGKTFTMTIHTGTNGGPGFVSLPERWLASLPRDAFQYLRCVRLQLEMRALRNFARSATHLVVDLRGDGGLPALVSVSQELHPLYDQRQFEIFRSQVERFVGGLNQRNARQAGVRKEHISGLFGLLKGIIKGDRKKYSDWRERILGIYREGGLIKCRRGFPYD